MVATTVFSYPVGTKIQAGEVWLGRSAGAWEFVFSEQVWLRWTCSAWPRASDVLQQQLSGQPFGFYAETVTVEANSEGGFNDVKTRPLRFVAHFADH